MFTQPDHRLNHLPSVTSATLPGSLLQNLWRDHKATSRTMTETVEGRHHAVGIVKCVKKQNYFFSRNTLCILKQKSSCNSPMLRKQ